MATDVGSLVDAERGLLSRRIFIEPEIYGQEQRQIFARCWLFLCHDSQVARPGDFFTTSMGEDPVLVVRDTGGRVHAFLHVCRHRGNRLCRADNGNAASFTCAYHGWTYANDGRLTGVPYLREAYHGELDRDRWGLIPVAQLDQYKGLWFATFDPEAPPLREYLGEMRWYLDAFVDRREGGIEIVATHKWIIPIVGTVFPNFSLLRATSRTLRVWQPRGPDKTEVSSWVFIDKAAPPAIKEQIRLAGVRGFSPSGSFEQDDMDNWQECTRTCRGVMARRMPLNTQMGLGHERFDDGLNGWASDWRMSESNHRQFYRRWAEVMTADNWAALSNGKANGGGRHA